MPNHLPFAFRRACAALGLAIVLSGCAATTRPLELDPVAAGSASAELVEPSEPEVEARTAPSEPRLFRGVIVETDPEDAEIVASGRYKSKNGRLEVPISADAYALPRAFTVTIRHRDYPTVRQTIASRMDWVRFFMIAGPISLVAIGNTFPLLDPAQTTAVKLAGGLTVAGTLLSIGQIYFQSHKFDDVYVIDLEKASAR